MEIEELDLDHEQRCAIAQNLSELMVIRNTTETKVAQELNIPVMTIRRLLSGETTDPRVYTLKTVADYFGVTVDTLLAPNSKTNPHHLNHSRPTFVPVFDWDTAKNAGAVDLKKWKEWLPITIEKNQSLSAQAFALESRPSMYPRYSPGTVFVFDPELTPADGDLVLVNLRENNELTLRGLYIDPPEWELHPINQGAPILKFDKNAHEIVAVVFLTLFFNRKIRSQG
ncbi:helix-turn-helix domain-containing protein [Legionella taurinensis]|uniref:Helix-turn-helix domain-containing protein n=1 Tax=Legionella taurinensis TaxID=70611 RepID=A0AB38N0F9_9GAMM|nr:S24 family peptidase [Legionella taurinensis]MDX1838849.1 S24 family peptidase [Legionella taurinensis]PUT38562.1 peptidase S24 [Legionella taurinensis]PUT39330.1 peptidase S24 [Legionella taurinensis]PUT41054.1 peptidase S24 [Legionella taurinensis]PUT44484.1 peptidase S24 [Legionella taurinensis]